MHMFENDQYFRQLKKGVLEMIVLKTLSHKKMYGYQVMMTLKYESDYFFNLCAGTLYPLLHRLEKNGLLKSTWESPEPGKMPKTYYEITDEGRVELAAQTELWATFSDHVFHIMTSHKFKTIQKPLPIPVFSHNHP